MRRTAGLAREELFPGLGGDELFRADMLGDLEVEELLALLPLELADANPCPSRVRVPLDIVPTRTSLPPR
jgi:hypothetical protein